MKYNESFNYYGINDQLYRGQYAKINVIHEIDNEGNDSIISRKISVYDSMDRLCYSRPHEIAGRM